MQIYEFCSATFEVVSSASASFKLASNCVSTYMRPSESLGLTKGHSECSESERLSEMYDRLRQRKFQRSDHRLKELDKRTGALKVNVKGCALELQQRQGVVGKVMLQKSLERKGRIQQRSAHSRPMGMPIPRGNTKSPELPTIVQPVYKMLTASDSPDMLVRDFDMTYYMSRMLDLAASHGPHHTGIKSARRIFA